MNVAAPRLVSDLRLSLKAAGFSPIPVAGKRPAMSGWQTKNNVDDAEITSWDTLFSGCTNTGILTEQTPALDIDIKHQEAADAVSELVQELYGDKGTLITRFGLAPKRAILFRTSQPFSKQQVTFTAQDGSTHKVEILCSGQQLVAEGIHPDTRKPYFWHGGYAPGVVKWEDLPEIEEEEAATLLTLIQEMLAEKFWFQEQQSGSAAPLGEGGRDGLPPFEVDEELAAMAPGSVNAVQCRVTASMLSRGVPLEDVVNTVCDATMDVAARHGLAWDRDQEINGGKDFPGLQKICVSWLKKLNDDYDHRLGEIPMWVPEDLRDRWADAVHAGRRPRLVHKGLKGEVRSWEGAEVIPIHGGASSDSEPPPEDEPPPGAAPPPPKDRFKRVFEPRPFVPFDVAALPPRSWLYGKHYQRRTVSLTAGPGGMGKSSLDMVEVIAMTTARNLLGEQPGERLRAWYHNGDDSREEIDRRLAAICQKYKIPMEELQGYLWTSSGAEFPLRVAKGYNNLVIDAALVRQISGFISTNQIDVAIFDPLVSLHDVSEMDTGKMDRVIRVFGEIADDNDAAIELAHHVRKPAPGETANYDVYDIRGVKAITDAVRAARVLNHMDEKDAEAAGCSDLERMSRFKVDRAKGNYSSAAQTATWRQFISVELPNGDDVGVVVPWDYPGQGEQTPEKAAADQKAEHVFLLLLDKFTSRGMDVSASFSPNYAPARFAKEQEAKAAKVSKAALTGALTRLLDSGRVRAEQTGRSDRRSHRLVAWHGDAK